MKKVMYLFVVLITFFVGCAGEEEESREENIARIRAETASLFGPVVTYTIKVISIPPGARIEMDNDYLGDAPLEIPWESRPGRYFKTHHTISALPIFKGQHTQTKHFFSRDTIPKTILFDMNLVSVPRRYEIDIE